MMSQDTLLINNSTIQELMPISEINQIVDQTFQGLADHSIVNPSKVSLDLGETGNYPYYEGFMNAMPAYLGKEDVAGLKWVGGFLGERKEAGLPYITAMTTLLNPHLGTFLAVMDGAYISNMRTGAQAAIAIEYLFRKPSITIGLFGAGMQARTTIMAIADRMNIDKLIVWNHRKITADKFKAEMEDFVTGDLIVTENPEEACKADVLITLTPAQTPLFQADWVEPGTVIFPMGSFQEIPDNIILQADKIIVDHVDQALNRGALKKLHKEGKVTESHIDSTIGDHAHSQTGLTNLENEIVICIPIGTGAMDVAVANAVYHKALEQGKGSRFNFLA